MKQRFEGVRSNPAMQGTACRRAFAPLCPADAAPDRERWTSQKTFVYGDDYGSGSHTRRSC
jgi:hypothetical protein